MATPPAVKYPVPGAHWVIFYPCHPTILHFTNHRFVRRLVKDPITGSPKFLDVLELDVDEWEGVKGSWVLSITSKKFQAPILPLIESGEIYRRKWKIHMTGEGFRREYSIQPVE